MTYQLAIARNKKYDIKGYARFEFGSECSRVGPVSEATSIAVWTATTGDDEGEKDDADDDDDLDRRQPELKLAKELNATEVVDAEDDDDEDGLSIISISIIPVCGRTGENREISQ